MTAHMQRRSALSAELERAHEEAAVLSKGLASLQAAPVFDERKFRELTELYTVVNKHVERLAADLREIDAKYSDAI